MTRETDEDDFARGLSDLLVRFDLSLGSNARGPYAGESAGRPHEHTTRVHFLDELVELLGWRLGLDGDVSEEARLRQNTVTRMDYLGVESESNAPVLLIEAKAWDKPFVSPRTQATNFSYESLIAEAVDHWRNGGGQTTSPVMPEWHGHLEQVGGYVRGLLARGHELPRAVLTSGQWIIVFKRPVMTFSTGPASANDIEIFHKQDFVLKARTLFELLSAATLRVEYPFRIRATQVLNYIASEAVVDCFHALHLSYEASGSQLFSQRPRILIYPALVLRRDDGALLTIIEDDDPFELSYDNGGEDQNTALEPHLASVATAAANLLGRVNEQLDREVPVSDLREFPGYPMRAELDRMRTKLFVKRHPFANDHWIVVTGNAPHFLHAAPVTTCRFHRWRECHSVGQGGDGMAIMAPSIGRPRSFFIDEQPHHCAHQGIQDRRESHCQIHPIDQRICCKSCLFASVCWTNNVRPPLPCGG